MRGKKEGDNQGTVTVSVVGLDDYLPVFLNTEHNVQVPEDARLGMEVLRMATLTRPGAENTGYRIVSGNEQGRFRLDARTGEPAPAPALPLHAETRSRSASHGAHLPRAAPPQADLLWLFLPLRMHLFSYLVPSSTVGPA